MEPASGCSLVTGASAPSSTTGPVGRRGGRAATVSRRGDPVLGWNQPRVAGSRDRPRGGLPRPPRWRGLATTYPPSVVEEVAQRPSRDVVSWCWEGTSLGLKAGPSMGRLRERALAAPP